MNEIEELLTVWKQIKILNVSIETRSDCKFHIEARIKELTGADYSLH